VIFSAWLRANNCEQYADTFEANDIGLDILGELTDQDLAELGCRSAIAAGY
jgi:SAM domain (Sterile alpha motif)